jgi:hypothetical protein
MGFSVMGDTRVELVTPSVSYYPEALSPIIYVVASSALGAAKSILERSKLSSLFALVYHYLSKLARKEGCILGCISLSANVKR